MKIEFNSSFVENNPTIQTPEGIALVTPPINDDYWLMRVKLTESQSIVAFPKFFTIGIGFQHEEDWNTNLPYTEPADRIFRHIAKNKGDSQILDTDCIKAIEAIQEAIRKIEGAGGDQ